MSKIAAEYIWLDGTKPTAQLRSKTKILEGEVRKLEDFPEWSFDGSSTNQAEGSSSDCVLKPVYFVRDPLRGGENVLVLCEVYDSEQQAHESNTRANLVKIADKYKTDECLFGIEQEYTFIKDSNPLGWPDKGYPGPQGPYYCAVGAENVSGRQIVERHLKTCLDAGLSVSGINAEVMCAQWEFQVGALGPLDVSDQLWISRWLLYRVAEDFGVSVSLDPKPVLGDWNGSGAHINFSTKKMRESGGLSHINEACEKLGNFHKEHVEVYGDDNSKRLTGLHETCSIDEFKYGVSDRGASIRIPIGTSQKGCGYLEDRRPAANVDPYIACRALMETVCGSGFRK